MASPEPGERKEGTWSGDWVGHGSKAQEWGGVSCLRHGQGPSSSSLPLSKGTARPPTQDPLLSISPDPALASQERLFLLLCPLTSASHCTFSVHSGKSWGLRSAPTSPELAWPGVLV